MWLGLAGVAWCEAELTLEQAVALALKGNRLVKNAALEVEQSREEVAATRSYRLPALSFNVFESQLLTTLEFRFPRGAFGTFPGIGPVPPAEAPVATPRRPNTLVFANATQPLSQLYRIGLGIKAQELAHDAARERLGARELATANEVKKAYYGIQLTRSALEAAEEAIRLYKEVDRVVKEALAQQAVLPADTLEVQARLAKAEYDALQLRNNLATQKQQLNSLLGRDLRTDFQVTPVAASTDFDPDVEAARARSLQGRPEAREARLRAQQAEYDRSMKKAEYIPDVSLMFSYLSPFQIETVPKNIAAVGLLFQWNPFDWGKKKNELAVKSRAVERARNAIEETEAQISIEVEARHRKLEEARALVRVGELTREAAKEKVRVAMDRFRVETVLLKDVLQAQAGLADANHQYQQSLLAFWTARADFEKAVGER
jgi:outer membrane protein TolC